MVMTIQGKQHSQMHFIFENIINFFYAYFIEHLRSSNDNN